MCGLAAVVNFDSFPILPTERWPEFVKPLQYRGPDDTGHWHYANDNINAALFHTRLSIIDLNKTGHQPMISSDENVVVIYNGEIYNYKFLKEELIKHGCQFVSTSDTEVLLQGYQQWGIELLLKKIDGMFSILFFDKQNNRVTLARDRFGKKPLYYAILKKAIIVSSDIRSFYQVPDLKLELDVHSLGYFFYELTTPKINSIWKQIKKLPAAHYSTFTSSGFEQKRYWSLDYSESNLLSWNDTLERAEFLLYEAVKKRLVSDVPVAAQLSGGIDSSLVVAMMASIISGPVQTYSVVFDEPELDERRYARLVAERFGTKHHELRLSGMDASLMNEVIREYGEPFADTSMLPTYLICREISKSQKVVCGGDGGDELFAGYMINYFVNKLDSVKYFRSFYPVVKKLADIAPSYRLNLLRDLLKSARQPDYMLLNRNMGFCYAEVSALTNKIEATTAIDLEHSAIWNEFSSSSHNSINLLSSFMHTRLVNDYLVKVDRASMFASLEMRSPFLDKDLAAFAATLTRQDLFKKHGTKSILKSVAEKYFPKTFVHRNKMGFGVPVEHWLRGDFNKTFKDVVLGGKQKLIDLNYNLIEKLLSEHTEGKDHTEKLWLLYVFHVWAQQPELKFL